MNYWHMQLHAGDQKTFSIDTIIDILINKQIIGLGEWEEHKGQIDQFKNEMASGDIVVMRQGNTPIALVKVVGEHFIETNVDKDYDWFENRRPIQLLDIYQNDYSFIIPQARGTLQRCSNLNSPTSQVIINWYNRYLKEQNMNRRVKELIDLLKTKHQIILQGPPGTGKTRLAKELASELVKSNSFSDPIKIINSFIETFVVNQQIATNRQKCQELVSDFKDRFPIDHLKEISLNDYCIGTGQNDSFCWWLERGLSTLGKYWPQGGSAAYLIYWDKNSKIYQKNGFIASQNSDEEAMKAVSELIYKVVINKRPEDADGKIDHGFLLKILNCYYPEEFFPIYSDRILYSALRLFEIDGTELSAFDKNRRLILLCWNSFQLSLFIVS